MKFDREYFHTGTYEKVSFRRYSQYWWSNRFYARLAVRYGPSHGRVIEIGCGLGHLLSWLASDYQVYGVDINEWAIKQASSAVPGGHFLALSAQDLRIFPDSTFQVVIAKHVVEHLIDPEGAIAEVSRILSNGGLLILATPNLSSPTVKLQKKAWIGYQDPTHISLKSPAEWIEIARRYQLEPERIFSDGFWAAPYLPVIPSAVQKLIFGLPGGLQAMFGWSIIPLWLGESMIMIAKKAG